jgi:putative membrane protein
MIIYNTKDWRKIFLSAFGFGSAYNAKDLFQIQAFILAYCLLVVYLRHYHYPPERLSIQLDPTFLSLVGVILGLSLVFRVNSSYERWWEGRKQWGALVNHSRTLAAYFHAVLPEHDQTNRYYVAAHIANFAYALKGHLRAKINWEMFDYPNEKEKKDMQQAGHLPYQVASYLFKKTEELFRSGLLCEADKINIKQQIQAMIDVLGACERIKNTPIPFSHTSFIKTFIIFYAFFLPIGLVDKFGWYTVPAVFLISYALAGVEVISEEIEQPFGTDANDLPLRHLSNVIKQNTYDILQVSSQTSLPVAIIRDGVLI